MFERYSYLKREKERRRKQRSEAILGPENELASEQDDAELASHQSGAQKAFGAVGYAWQVITNLFYLRPCTHKRAAIGGCRDEGEIVGGELVVSGRDAPALLDLVEEPLDQITVAVKVGTEADRVLAIAFRRDVCPRALIAGERSDPVRVISSICQQHGSWLQSGQEHRT